MLISAGIGIGIQGITQLLTKPPSHSKQKKDPGIFNGPESTIQLGQPVPILYGELLIAGAPIHVDFKRGQPPQWTLSVPSATNPHNLNLTSVQERSTESVDEHSLPSLDFLIDLGNINIGTINI